MSTGFFALEHPVYAPAMRLIQAITQAPHAEVTTSFAHGYISKTVVRIDVPFEFGMQQINQRTGSIVVTGDTTFTIDIDTSFFDPFSVPSPLPHHLQSWAQVVPIGEDNDTLDAAVKNTL
jgi:hypothetical protein